MVNDIKEQPYVDPGHRVPDNQWGQVVRSAQKIRAESNESETE